MPPTTGKPPPYPPHHSCVRSRTAASRTRDYTGSYQEQKGRTFTTYDASRDSTYVEELGENHYRVPFGLFNPEHLRNLGIVSRTDGDFVVMDVYICDGASCDSEGATGQSHTTEGVLFDEYDMIFTNDENRFPLEAGDIRVTSLHTNPPEPPATPETGAGTEPASLE